jgi:outer membrane protein TolC
LFDGGATQAQVEVQQAALEQARQAYQLAVLTALKEVEDALVALGGEAARLAHLQQAAQAAGNAALLAQQRYDSGLIDFASVLETQRTQLSTQDALATSQATLGSNHVRLFKALGGGWQRACCTPAPFDEPSQFP